MSRLARLTRQSLVSHQFVPAEETMQQWVDLVSNHLRQHMPKTINTSYQYELTARVVDCQTIQATNRDYRHRDKPTNVISFPFIYPPALELPVLGDILLCAEIINTEAVAQHKTATAHWAHMLIHSTLHCFGFDHIEAQDADLMESIEIELLAILGYSNPYGAISHHD